MFNIGYRMLGAGAWGWSREMIWGGRWEGDSGLRACIHPWWIHVNVWQNQYSIVKQNQVKKKIKKKKFSKPGFSNTWTVNFQMFKVVLEMAEEPEIKLPTSRRIIKRAREFQKNIYFCFIDYAKAFDYVDHDTLWKILKEMGIPDHLTCFLRNPYAGQEATVRTGHRTTDWFKIGKGVR